MPAHRHVHHGTPPITETEYAAQRWADDGGAQPEPSASVQAAAEEWRRISQELTERFPEIIGRRGVTVTCQPGTRSGAKAAYFPDTVEVELDAATFKGLDPVYITPRYVGDERYYRPAWGALVHEGAHANHSKWRTPQEMVGSAAEAAAVILEETRAEARHLRRKRGREHRRYLRACATDLVMADGFDAQCPDDAWIAARAAGLIIARRDAKILETPEIQPLRKAVTKILGRDRLKALTQIWRKARRVADLDAKAILELGVEWCQVLGVDPQGAEPEPGELEPVGTVGALSGAIEKVGGLIAAAEAAEDRREADQAFADYFDRFTSTVREAMSTEPGPDRVKARASADKVFAKRGKAETSHVTGSRLPTAEERSAAARLARQLRQAAYRERQETKMTSASPPGRLNMRGALVRDAQRAAGAVPTAEPWSITRRRHAPMPPLRVGVAVDVSASMSDATAPIASAAWILAKAAAMTDPDSKSATVSYNNALTAITYPGRAPVHVTEFQATRAGHRLDDTIDALNRGLDLDRPGAGRLLVIASDGQYGLREAAPAAARIKALLEAGCAVLWLTFDNRSTPLPGATVLNLTDPAEAVAAISKAATAAIATTR
ncbi:VWA domain-containing protein [Catenulispora rubra]|uniref:VWA domain-containing protein n=1 Tax=Catenulispora rubra TaxID=280293 RepID=UPI00189267EC|nr:VWA domain-containing protein [Catenulispora rubra]